jgi:hypothetical protein
LAVYSEPSAAAVQEMVTSADGYRGAGITTTTTGDGTLWGEPILVVSQKAKLIEVTNQYSVFDQAGRQKVHDRGRAPRRR